MCPRRHLLKNYSHILRNAYYNKLSIHYWKKPSNWSHYNNKKEPTYNGVSLRICFFSHILLKIDMDNGYLYFYKCMSTILTVEILTFCRYLYHFWKFQVVYKAQYIISGISPKLKMSELRARYLFNKTQLNMFFYAYQVEVADNFVEKSIKDQTY